MGGMIKLTDPRTYITFGVNADDIQGINVNPDAARKLNDSINPVSEQLTIIYTRKGNVALALEPVEHVIDEINQHRSASLPPVQMRDDFEEETRQAPARRVSGNAADPEMAAREGVQEGVKERVGNQQKAYYLRQQIEEAQKQLKDLGEDDGEDDNDRLKRMLAASDMAPEVRAEAEKEFKRLLKMQPTSAEAVVSRTYLETLAVMPWAKSSETMKDMSKSETILNDEHYGLEKVKDAILDHLAVLNQPGATGEGKTLCLIGPPGVGKTSIGMSIAHATGRVFQRISLGGVSDEADIRGHRRTYIGAQPGTIAVALKRAGVNNPVLLFDEIDKMGKTERGDPGAAMLEALDPKQNNTFKDHYLDVPLDLSKALKICTANDEDGIPGPLADRMKIIRLPGYTREQKLEIGKRFLVGRCLKEAGLSPDKVEFTDGALRSIIGNYTYEAGVRNLETVIGTCCAKAVRALQKDPDTKVSFTEENLTDYIGKPNGGRSSVPKEDGVGVVNGLAYTPAGGCTLQIEALITPGKDFGLAATGNMKEVMKELASVAHMVAELLAPDLCAKFNATAKDLKTSNIHVHVLAGATPKDGPSAGAAFTTAMLSALTGQKVRHDVAMTGEISLHGDVLPIGGLPEKLDGALRDGAKTVLVPIANERDLDNVPKEVKDKLTIHLVSNIHEVLDYAFVNAPSTFKGPEPANTNTVTAPAAPRPATTPMQPA